jgi:hypothetical protein
MAGHVLGSRLEADPVLRILVFDRLVLLAQPLHRLAICNRIDPGGKLARAMETVGAVPDHHHRVIQYLFDKCRPPDQRLQKTRQPRMVLAIELLERGAVPVADLCEQFEIAFGRGRPILFPKPLRNFFSCHLWRLLIDPTVSIGSFGISSRESPHPLLKDRRRGLHFGRQVSPMAAAARSR